jgi:hypothetical protein
LPSMRHGRRLQYAFHLLGQMPRSVVQFFPDSTGCSGKNLSH